MPTVHVTTELERFEFGIVRRKVRQLIGRAGFKWQDKEDLQQEIMARLLHSMKSFNPARGHRKAFIVAAVERSVASMLRDHQAPKRHHPGVVSLQQPRELEGSPTVLAQTISDRELQARVCRHPRSVEALARLGFDLTEVFNTLPDDLRELAERLKTQSISAIARAMDIPRTTLVESVRQLRQRFDGAGLREYF